jgi:hypothetical protein
MLNIEVRELYEEWMAEDDEEAAEMIYCAYLYALRKPEDRVEDDTDDDLDQLPIGIRLS